MLILLRLQHEPMRSKPAKPKRSTFQRLESGCLEAGDLQAGNLEAGSVEAWHRHNDTTYFLSFIHGIETMTPFTCSHFITNPQPIQSSHRKCSAWTQRLQTSGHQYQSSAAGDLELCMHWTSTCPLRRSWWTWDGNVEIGSNEWDGPHPSPCS